MNTWEDGVEDDVFRSLENDEEDEVSAMDALDSGPAAYDVPHHEWRPSQWDALSFALSEFNSGEKFVISELPTGVGKSGIATALGRDRPVLVLVHTLSLLDQYSQKYGFDVIKGSQEYACILEEKVAKWRARFNRVPMVSDCHFEKMQDCPRFDACTYIVARNRALASRRMGCTYRYAAVAGIVSKRPGIVVLDEAHSAADEILAMEETKVNELDRREFNLPSFPFIKPYGKGGGGDLLSAAPKQVLIAWLERACAALTTKSEAWDPEFAQRQRNMHNKLSRMIQVIDDVEWFMEAGPQAIEYWRKGRTEQIPGIRLRPLSAKGIARRLWNHKEHALLMSATIGDPVPLARELGINTYEFRTYPHPTPAAYRPVFDLGMERMIYEKYNANPELFRMQAQKIVRFINKWPPMWRGLILTSSYEKIRQMRKYLTPPLGVRLANHGEASDMEEWMKMMRPGEIALQTMQGWGHGIDLYGDMARFMVMGSVPFKNPTDRYEQVRQSAYGNADFFWWSCYVSVPQATGRVSRGERDAAGNWMLNPSALADGSAMTGAAQRFYPAYFKEAIIPWRAA